MKKGGRREAGLVIAIDGPSGAGKSTVTKLLAHRLGYIHIDTGAMFRAIALMVDRAGVDPDDDAKIAAICAGADIEFRCVGSVRNAVFLNGENVSAAIRTPRISMLTSRISAKKVVRDLLLGMQRRMGREGGVVLEGRDIGTIVFPDAEVKFYLSASPEERAKRRHRELLEKGETVTYEETVRDVLARDRQDATRELAPLRKADDAVEIDSTFLDVDGVVSAMERVVAERCRTLCRCGSGTTREDA